MRFNAQKISHIEPSVKTSAQLYKNSNTEKKTLPYPSDSTYALHRRLIVPKWWVESLLFTLGKKNAWYENFINDHVDQRIYEYFKVTSSNIFLMFFIWHELTKLMFASAHKTPGKIRLDLTPFLQSAGKNTGRALKTLENSLITPTKIFDISAVDKKDHKELVIQQNGFVNIFRQVSLEQNVNGIWLTLHFAQKLSNLFIAPDCISSIKSNTHSFVSINPNLFYAMGSRINMQIALNGLFLEYQKQYMGDDDDFTSFSIQSEKLDQFHNQSIQTGKLLFCHGIIRGHNNLPSGKISQLKKNQKSLNPDRDTPFIFTWNVGAQTKEARQFETLLSKYLHEIRIQYPHKTKSKIFREPPKDELGKMRHRQEETVKHAPVGIKKQNYISHGLTLSANSNQPNFYTCSEKELSIFVARFYESLNQKQKKMFESERKKMNNEQFRAFMIPILQRTHNRLPT